MTRKEISDGIRKIAWSYFFIYFHINLGTIDILPDWWGYMLIYNGINILKNDEPETELLIPLCRIFIAYKFAEWLVKIVGISLDIPVVGIILNILLLYFNFQLLTNIANIAARYGCGEERRIRQLIVIRTVISAVTSFPVNWIKYQWVIVAFAVITLIIAVWTMILLFCLKDSVMEGMENEINN